MKGKLDIPKMEAAFKRAAYKAIHGTREERSGRFAPQKDRQTVDPNKRKTAPRGDRTAVG